ncbi:MAG: prolyl oligopeptidase family serine peptidase [Verrucomicrobiaceae bacterium]|nr:prolyl oligopeptidase family serine peptidase [Verrucomicrobiaceae bacterium]
MKSLLFFTLSLSAFAADFEAALSFPKRTENKVFRDRVQANWLPDGKTFWYRVQTAPGKSEFVLINATNGSRKTAATLKDLGLPEKEAAKTSTIKIELRRTKRTGESSSLKFVNQLDEDVELYWINQEGGHVRYGGVRAGTEREQHTFDGHVWLITSRTGEHLAVVEGASQAQTFIIDGKGISKANTEASKKPERGFRAPDGSCVVFTEAEKVERRKVAIVESTPDGSVQPKLKVFDYIKPGDPLPKPQWVIEKSDGTKLRVARDLYENPFTESGELDAVWAPDSSEFYFNYNQRGHQLYRILAVNAKTGAVRVVVEETSKTFIHYSGKSWRHWLHGSGEIIWMSERDGWCHLWLYDAKKGTPKHQITKGTWPVREVLHVDQAKKEIWFLASGLRAKEDPYHTHLCRVNMDGSGFQQLTEGDGNHRVEFSPNREFFVDTWSRADKPPVMELRRSRDGGLVCELEKAEVSALLAAGWTMPERFVAKGRDGKTDIHGVIVKPSNFDPAKKYPVVENIYAGPHGSFAPKEFSRLMGHHVIAELGFIVVQLDGMGTNHRGKAFHDVCWKNLKDAGFPDRKLWIKEAAKTRPWMDLRRVGIYGGSAGGQNAMRALLDHHDFYHVAVADCGCHDNRMDKIWWNEQWMGWPVDESYVKSSNKEDANKLQGHLLLIVGELDTNVDPASTTQVVAALQKAGKSFDFMPIAGTGHGATETPYGSRLRMEFLVRHLKP